MNKKKLGICIGIGIVGAIVGEASRLAISSLKDRRYKKINDMLGKGSIEKKSSSEMRYFCSLCEQILNDDTVIHGLSNLADLPIKIEEAAEKSLKELQELDEDLKDCTAVDFYEQILSDMLIDLKGEFREIYDAVMNHDVTTLIEIGGEKITECYTYLINENVDGIIQSHFI